MEEGGGVGGLASQPPGAGGGARRRRGGAGSLPGGGHLGGALGAAAGGGAHRELLGLQLQRLDLPALSHARPPAPPLRPPSPPGSGLSPRPPQFNELLLGGSGHPLWRLGGDGWGRKTNWRRRRRGAGGSGGSRRDGSRAADPFIVQRRQKRRLPFQLEPVLRQAPREGPARDPPTTQRGARCPGVTAPRSSWPPRPGPAARTCVRSRRPDPATLRPRPLGSSRVGAPTLPCPSPSGGGGEGVPSAPVLPGQAPPPLPPARQRPKPAPSRASGRRAGPRRRCRRGRLRSGGGARS